MSNTTTKSFNVVKINTDFTMASTKTNITSGENLMVSLGKIAKWYDATNGFASSSVTIPSITLSSDGTTGNAITNISASNHALTLSKGSFIPLSGSSSIGGELTPASNETYDLGSNTYRWRDCYFKYVNTENLYAANGSQGGSITSNASIIPYSTGILDLGSSNKYWENAYVNHLTLANPLPVASGGTGCTSLADLKIALDIESFSDPTLVTETTLDTIEGTSVFMGVNQPFGEQYDWVGIQIGSSEVSRSGDVFQLVSVNTSDKQLLFRKNDLGEWNDWRRICFYDELPTIDSSLSSSSTNPVQNKVINTALGNKLDSSTVDSSGSSGSSGWYNCRINNGKIQYYNTDTTYTTTSSVTSGSSALVTSGGVYSALSSKVNSSSLGDAAYKNYTTSVTSGSSNLVTSDGVYTALTYKNLTLNSAATSSYEIHYNTSLRIVYGEIEYTSSSASAGTRQILGNVPSTYRPTYNVPAAAFVVGQSVPCLAWIATGGNIYVQPDQAVSANAIIRVAFCYAY